MSYETDRIEALEKLVCEKAMEINALKSERDLLERALRLACEQCEWEGCPSSASKHSENKECEKCWMDHFIEKAREM